MGPSDVDQLLTVMRKHKVASFELGDLKVAFDSAIPVMPPPSPSQHHDPDFYAESAAAELAAYMSEGGE